MAKEEKIRTTGRVIEQLPNSTFIVSVEIEDGEHDVVGYLSGKMRKNKIYVIVGDEVDIEISPYDLTKGRIVYVHRKR